MCECGSNRQKASPRRLPASERIIGEAGGNRHAKQRDGGYSGRVLIQGHLVLDAERRPVPGWIRLGGGAIEEVGEGEPPGAPDAGGADRLISPGFIDAHIHLPQIDSVGFDRLPLLEWLDRVIYPAEARWSDAAFARGQIERAYGRMLRAGTLGYAGYLTSHPAGVEEVIRAAHRLPLRAIVGQSLMDRFAPEALLGRAQARLARSARGRLDTSLNPRFAVACSDDLMARIGAQLRAGFPASPKKRDPGDMGTNLFLQTHLAETQAECDRVHELFPDDPHYTAVYDRFGMLGEHTLLAHGVHLSDAEWELIAARRSVVVHCPGANTFLGSGLFDLDEAREHGARLALGSDIAAGPDIAMPRVARAMIEVAKMRAMTIAPAARIPTPGEAWNLITRGNADALGWKDAGRIEAGASADLLILRPPFEIDENVIARLLYEWDDRMIDSRVLNGMVLAT